MNQQPKFSNLEGAAAGTDFDAMSDEQLQELINASIKLKTGRPGQHHKTPPPPEKKHIDLDALIKSYGGK